VRSETALMCHRPLFRLLKTIPLSTTSMSDEL
jgi:hypothetical protein